nr:hypothetical protein B0A51_03733 [Rachicladosporium sp. CCFEE 5018]OQO29011.1 hypothetical protein B0A51_03593 [Rachicladosporium sp. CCFEE 5018]
MPSEAPTPAPTATEREGGGGGAGIKELALAIAEVDDEGLVLESSAAAGVVLEIVELEVAIVAALDAVVLNGNGSFTIVGAATRQTSAQNSAHAFD